jgi:hypothetical protein
VPRFNPHRALANERNVAARIAYERTRLDRKWTYEGMAKRMEDLGFPIQASAIYKIEKADPPRRIAVDELVAFADLFRVRVEDLLRPMEEVMDRDAQKILREFARLHDQLRDCADKLLTAFVQFNRLDEESRRRVTALGVKEVLERGPSVQPKRRTNASDAMHQAANPSAVEQAIAALIDATDAQARLTGGSDGKH